MAINPDPKVLSNYAPSPEVYHDAESVDVSSLDYSPTDSNGNPVVCRGFVFTSGGDISIRTAGGNDIVFTGLSTRTIYPIAFTKIYSAATDASNIWALV